MLTARHRAHLICLGREEPLNLGQRDQGMVPRMFCLRPRVMLASKRRLDHLENNSPDGA